MSEVVVATRVSRLPGMACKRCECLRVNLILDGWCFI
jgi:hypothetical protein